MAKTTFTSARPPKAKSPNDLSSRHLASPHHERNHRDGSPEEDVAPPGHVDAEELPDSVLDPEAAHASRHQHGEEGDDFQKILQGTHGIASGLGFTESQALINLSTAPFNVSRIKEGSPVPIISTAQVDATRVWLGLRNSSTA